MHVGLYLRKVQSGEQQLCEAFERVARRHAKDYDISEVCRQLAEWSSVHLFILEPLVAQCGAPASAAPQLGLFRGRRSGPFGLLQDLEDLLLLATMVRTTWTILLQAARTLKDTGLAEPCVELGEQTSRQIEWLRTRIKIAAPQTLTVPDSGSPLRGARPKPAARSTVDIRLPADVTPA